MYFQTGFYCLFGILGYYMFPFLINYVSNKLNNSTQKEFLIVDFFYKNQNFDIKKLNLNKKCLLYYVEYKFYDTYYTFLYNTRTDTYFEFGHGLIEEHKIFQNSIKDVFESEFLEIFVKELI